MSHALRYSGHFGELLFFLFLFLFLFLSPPPLWHKNGMGTRGGLRYAKIPPPVSLSNQKKKKRACGPWLSLPELQ